MKGVIENKFGQKAEDVIDIVERVNNSKRNFLIMNKLQGKYIPVNPYIALDMFDKLADQIEYIEGKILVVGFAETATAIGCEVAYRLSLKGKDVDVMHTTRVAHPGKPVYKFREEHSHAVDQLLYISRDELAAYDSIVFVEDEVTTGDTICNIVKLLHADGIKADIRVASVINCMSEDEMLRFEEMGVKACWLMKLGKEALSVEGTGYRYTHLTLELPNTRFKVDTEDYYAQLKKVMNEVLQSVNVSDNSTVLVIGTEECMYPAMCLAMFLKARVSQTDVVATTRVPIHVEGEIFSRDIVGSSYGNYTTSIYNLRKYDTAVVVSDAECGSCAELCDILLTKYGINDITEVSLVNNKE